MQGRSGASQPGRGIIGGDRTSASSLRPSLCAVHVSGQFFPADGCQSAKFGSICLRMSQQKRNSLLLCSGIAL